MELAGQKFTVTGGAGFIGSHLVDALLSKGASVTVIDDLSYGSLVNLSAALPHIEFIQASILDVSALEVAVEDAVGVFHLAAVASVVESIDDPVRTHDVNATGTLRLLEVARHCKSPPKIVFSSSAAVYGDDPSVPKVETMPARPVNPYGGQKLIGELYLSNYHRLHGVSGVSLRYFNVYGPRQNPASMYSGVVSLFCDRVRRGAELRVHGDGNATRDFVFVDDVVRANIDSMVSQVDDGRALNIGTGRPTSVRELASLVFSLYSKPEEVTFGPRRAGDIRDSYAEVTAVMAAIGFSASVTLTEGLSRICQP